MSPRRSRSCTSRAASPKRSDSSNRISTRLVWPPGRGPDSALKPADTHAASDAPVDATTRTAKADVLSSWSTDPKIEAL